MLTDSTTNGNLCTSSNIETASSTFKGLQNWTETPYGQSGVEKAFIDVVEMTIKTGFLCFNYFFPLLRVVEDNFYPLSFLNSQYFPLSTTTI